MAALFYRAVIQAFLLFGLESWVLLYVMIRMVESTHVGFLFNITGKRLRRQADGLWETPAAKEVLQTVGIQSSATYIGTWQATVAKWVALRPLLEVCTR